MIKHKYNAVICECDGMKFSSKLEKNYYSQLKILKQSGEIAFFLRQVPFDLPGNTKYRCDFMIARKNGCIEFIDCKGPDTPISTLKIKQVEALYPIKIKIVKKV